MTFPHPFLLVGIALLAGCAIPPEASRPAASPDASLLVPVGLRAANRDFVTSLGARAEGMPPNARPGQCFIRATTPAVMAQTSERRLVRAAATQVTTVPAEFRTVEDRVVTRPASRRIEVIEAEFADRTETVVSRPASTDRKSVV